MSCRLFGIPNAHRLPSKFTNSVCDLFADGIESAIQRLCSAGGKEEAHDLVQLAICDSCDCTKTSVCRKGMRRDREVRKATRNTADWSGYKDTLMLKYDAKAIYSAEQAMHPLLKQIEM